MMTLMPVAAFAAAPSDATVEKVAVDQSTVTITMDKTITTASAAGFTVTGATVNSASAANKVITLTVTPAIADGTTVTVAYDGTGIVADPAGYLVSNFSKTVVAAEERAAATTEANAFYAIVTADTSTPTSAEIAAYYKLSPAAKALVDARYTQLAAYMANLQSTAQVAVVDNSLFQAVDGNETVKAVTVIGDVAGKEVTFEFYGYDAWNRETSVALPQTVYIWAVDEDGAVTSAMNVVPIGNAATCSSNGTYANAYEIAANQLQDGMQYAISFTKAGKYTVYAGVQKNNNNAANLSGLQIIGKTKSNCSVITVTETALDPEEVYSAYVDNANNTALGYTVTPAGTATNPVTAKDAAKGQELGTLKITPNNVATKKINVYFLTKDASGLNKALTGKTIDIDTNSANINVTCDNNKTNNNGRIQIEVSASREGKYDIYFEVDGVQYVLKVEAGNTSAAYIDVDDQPTAPIALYDDIDGAVTFEVTDINGNTVKEANGSSDNQAQGMQGIFGAPAKAAVKDKYLLFVEKPAASTLESSDLQLKYVAADQNYALVTPTFDAEGTYTVKAILDNGSVATATWEVKKFQTPVKIYMEVADQVELGKTVGPKAKYVDANGVTKTAKDATISATGYAIAHLTDTVNGSATVTIKTDEKYAGTSFTLAAVSERYNLVATKEIKIAKEGSAVAFDKQSLEVNVNNKVDWKIVDEDGTPVKVNSADWVSTKYVVLDKPADAKVSVYDAKSFDNGAGRMALTSNKIGNVTVQVVVQTKLNTAIKDKNSDTTSTQTKYYTGTQIFAVGNGSVGDVVVMSIGSNEIVINDKTATIDAAPIIQNDRTYVPFRALAEAFGAEVAYDEATQAVTAELNGVTVVMTIGSATYTVNGAENTMDVAPFINGSRTMVPVRFAAEAFGIKVIPTYNPDGSTADILFNL